ncbi:MAG: hypothetical protein EON84_04445 [Bradyrhizobiaceae bacterium]|nr:hypothetical protein [Hyphomicrobiales bacterium]RYX98385.1 MAG: hypothetical protein EON84_04445 [Bradyrhizobiaceae bacterium]
MVFGFKRFRFQVPVSRNRNFDESKRAPPGRQQDSAGFFKAAPKLFWWFGKTAGLDLGPVTLLGA